jgi:hypothetical protein
MVVWLGQPGPATIVNLQNLHTMRSIFVVAALGALAVSAASGVSSQEPVAHGPAHFHANDDHLDHEGHGEEADVADVHEHEVEEVEVMEVDMGSMWGRTSGEGAHEHAHAHVHHERGSAGHSHDHSGSGACIHDDLLSRAARRDRSVSPQAYAEHGGGGGGGRKLAGEFQSIRVFLDLTKLETGA